MGDLLKVFPLDMHSPEVLIYFQFNFLVLANLLKTIPFYVAFGRLSCGDCHHDCRLLPHRKTHKMEISKIPHVTSRKRERTQLNSQDYGSRREYENEGNV